MVVYLFMETFDKMLLENKDGVEFKHAIESDMLKMIEDGSEDTFVFFSSPFDSHYFELDKLKDKKNVFLFLREDDVKMLKKIEGISKTLRLPKIVAEGVDPGMFAGMDRTNSYIIKAKWQARGMGKHIVKDKFDLLRIFDVVLNGVKVSSLYPEFPEYNKPLDEYNEAERVRIFNIINNVDVGRVRLDDPDEVTRLYRALKKNSVQIQEVIKFDNEYRVLYFNGTSIDDTLVWKRTGYKPGDNTKSKNELVSLKKEVGAGKAKTILREINRIGDSLGIPGLSFDLWTNSDGEFGIFEYSVQFGLAQPPEIVRIVSKQYTDAFIKVLKEKRK